MTAEQHLAVASTATEARERADRIRDGFARLAGLIEDVTAAYAARDWTALGYPTWDAYVSAEYGDALPALSRDRRREIVSSLRTAGMSTRAIAPVVGADQSTVTRDLRATDANASVDNVIGLDGRRRKAKAAAEPLAPEGLEEAASSLARFLKVDDDRDFDPDLVTGVEIRVYLPGRDGPWRIRVSGDRRDDSFVDEVIAAGKGNVRLELEYMYL